ncbi:MULTISPECIES: FadR/GntR family transcriptional regulator [Streptomyces]|uniref:FadR/GntR family transcriptional regulator n=1 Tax=Streptomyces TaxID=1883 RepID=UPI001586FA4D|nr:FCD domain-containing protein [Streptomyces sp. CAI-85]NUV61122.1 FadR family transcriptional regulator [Streptomyces sp. CAI-85]
MQPYAQRGLHGQTVETLAHRVLSGQLPEGTTLDIVALRHELGVSLTALRESLKVLAAKGMVDARQRRGTFVRPRADWNLLDADVLRWQFKDRRDNGASPALLRCLREVRSIVEPAAARLAALRRTDVDLEALDAALTAVKGRDGLVHTLKSDVAFHRALLAATHNELLERMETMVALGLTLRDHGADAVPCEADRSAHQRAVLAAVRRRDPNAAERAMRLLLGGRAPDTDGLTEGD